MGLVKTKNAPAKFPEKTEIAMFGAGCFWGVEDVFRKQKGVLATAVGYSGGHTKNPTYKEVCSDSTGHAEVVQVEFDPGVVSFEELVGLFWDIHNPTTPNRQGPDVGSQYRSAIFYYSDEQKTKAFASKDKLQKSGELDAPIVTEITSSGFFTKAEEYHQQYVEKGGRAACHFRRSIVAWDVKNFKKPSKDELRNKLSALQYKVTQEEGTERASQNEYWDNHRAGIYVDVISGEPLFSSLDKYDSGTGWPSFTKPLKPENVITRTDFKLFLPRTEVRSKNADSHLGHVFNDGPAPTGKRYCMNSAAMRFIPAEDLEKEGYGEFKALFGEKTK